MAEVATPSPPLSLPGSPPIPLAMPDRAVLGRPISEISSDKESTTRSRTVSRSSMPNLLDGAAGAPRRPGSRPLSEVQPNTSRPVSELAASPDLSEGRELGKEGKEGKEGKKRSSAPLPVHTITLNLNQYAASLANSPRSPLSPSLEAPPPPSPSSKPAPPKPEKPISLRSPSYTKELAKVAGVPEAPKGAAGGEEKGRGTDVPSEPSPKTDNAADEDSGPAPHPLLAAQRALLKPSPLRPALDSKAEPTMPPAQSAKSSFESPRSSGELPPLISRPPPKAKPSWLRRASGTAVFRSKSKTPPPKEGEMTASTSLPPALPPRKGSGGGLLGSSTSTSSSISEKAGAMGPPELPSRSLPNAAAGPSRSRLAGGEGQPAYLPPAPPVRDGTSSNIRGRIAAWGTSGFSRSESSSSLSFSAPSAFASAQQKLPAGAQKMLGQAGSAVSKGLAGLRARGVGGSISNMSSLTGGRSSLESSSSMHSLKVDRGRSISGGGPAERSGDGPFFPEGAILRAGTSRTGRIFGRNIAEAGRAWCVVDGNQHVTGRSEWESRRRGSLPALVVRAVEYLEVWGPKEEGIFRISGRSSHIARLRKDFDSGADIDLTGCDPGDLDPHAVSGIFKSYLRELPEPVLTQLLTPKFEAAVKARLALRQGGAAGEGTKHEDVAVLMQQLPAANWFLVADIIKLLDLIPRHTAANRMSLNSIMLSLGPSLNLPGPVLTELLDRRDELFKTPPPLSATQDLTDMIDFGDIMIAPPTMPAAAIDSPAASRSATPISVSTENSFALVNTSGGEGKKRSPKRVGSKPSLGRLFSGSSIHRTSADLKAALDAPRTSIVDNSPPRVDVPLDSPQLPTFETHDSDRTLKGASGAGSGATGAVVGLGLRRSLALDVERDAQEERVRPPSGTPIADLFSGTSTQLPPLRSSSAQSSPIANTSPVMRSLEFSRRPSAAFFSSTDRHVRSQSAHATPSLTTSATIPSSATFAAPTGIKRKEDVAEEKGEEEARTKRLSAGPGVLG